MNKIRYRKYDCVHYVKCMNKAAEKAFKTESYVEMKCNACKRYEQDKEWVVNQFFNLVGDIVDF